MRWESLSRSEAREHLAQLLASLPAAAERLAGQVAGTARLDASRDSLAPLWQWVLRQPNTGGVLAAGADGAPPWYPFRAAYCEHYGVEASLVDVVDGLAAYYAACLQAVQPRRVWTIGGKDAEDTGYVHFNSPVLQLDDHDVAPHSQLLTTVHKGVVVGDADRQAPETLTRLFDLAMVGATGDGPVDPVFFVTRTGPEELELTFDESLEEMLGAAFESLDDRVTAVPGVERVVWQDREIMLVSGPIRPEQLARRVAPLLHP